MIRRILKSLEFDSSPERLTGDPYNLRPQTPDEDDGPDEDDNNSREPRRPEEEQNSRRRIRAGGDEDKSKEFRLVNPRNITIITFIVKNVSSNPYLVFKNKLRRVIFAMGEDGEELIDVLDQVEKIGKSKVSSAVMHKLLKEWLRVGKYDRSIKAALFNWTPGVAQGFVKSGAEGGLDAWRKLCHKYTPMADDLQHIFIRQFMSIKPVTGSAMDNLFEIQRTRGSYIKAGSKEEPMCEKWIITQFTREGRTSSGYRTKTSRVRRRHV